MGNLTTTYQNEGGETIEQGSMRAWELTAEAAARVQRTLDDFPLGLVPPEIRSEWDDALRTVFHVRSQAQQITHAAQRFAEVGRENPVEAALDDARFAKVIR